MGITTFMHDTPPTRGLVWLALSETAVLQSQQYTDADDDDDDAGTGGQLSYAPSGTVPCRIYPVSVRGMGRVIGGAVSEQSTHYVVTPPGTTVNLTDQVIIDTRGTFQVTVVLDRSDAQTTMFEVFKVT
jgi:hypothetical protein